MVIAASTPAQKPIRFTEFYQLDPAKKLDVNPLAVPEENMG